MASHIAGIITKNSRGRKSDCAACETPRPVWKPRVQAASGQLQEMHQMKFKLIQKWIKTGGKEKHLQRISLQWIIQTILWWAFKMLHKHLLWFYEHGAAMVPVLWGHCGALWWPDLSGEHKHFVHRARCVQQEVRLPCGVMQEKQ